MIPVTHLTLSGERFTVWYRVRGEEKEALARAKDICLEQTVEFPEVLLPEGSIREEVTGRIESFEHFGSGAYLAKISFAVETTAWELTQFLNVIFGNISLKPGIRVERLELTPSLYQAFSGPRFGREDLRKLLGVMDRPLLCTALKPMGLSAKDLGEQAYQFALGGIDIIKDDHGLSDQPFAVFSERVRACVDRVAQANAETGGRCIYVPNISAPGKMGVERAFQAKEAGAGGLLVSPGLTGFGLLMELARNERLNLPLISHPTWLGSFVTSPDQGISHYTLFGQLVRLTGGDATIYPNYGGRFAFSKEECLEIVSATEAPMGGLKPIFPAPGGGMSVERAPEMLAAYGREVMFLIGGNLHQQGPDLVKNCRELVRKCKE